MRIHGVELKLMKAAKRVFSVGKGSRNEKPTRSASARSVPLRIEYPEETPRKILQSSSDLGLTSNEAKIVRSGTRGRWMFPVRTPDPKKPATDAAQVEDQMQVMRWRRNEVVASPTHARKSISPPTLRMSASARYDPPMGDPAETQTKPPLQSTSDVGLTAEERRASKKATWWYKSWKVPRIPRFRKKKSRRDRQVEGPATGGDDVVEYSSGSLNVSVGSEDVIITEPKKQPQIEVTVPVITASASSAASPTSLANKQGAEEEGEKTTASPQTPQSLSSGEEMVVVPGPPGQGTAAEANPDAGGVSSRGAQSAPKEETHDPKVR